MQAVKFREKKPMSNIAAALKAEVTRIARKEIKGEITRLQGAATQHRRDIAALKRQVAALEKALGKAKRVGAAAPSSEAADAGDAPGKKPLRFSAARLAAQRAKLGLSADAFGKLIGVSGQSVYKWESGKARPRASQLQAIASARGISKADAAARLAGS